MAGPGSSPLTRGKRRTPRAHDRATRLIPAHAGKTQSTSTEAALRGAHPRSRGENRRSPGNFALKKGSSPLTRGKPSNSLKRASRPRLIPAHAGKTLTGYRPSIRPWAHPRSRGENVFASGSAKNVPGSSPLTRGKPLRVRGSRND